MLDPEFNHLKHRDLDWLNFNKRVLQEADDSDNPVYERLKFLAIFSSNLDEYFRVRVSQLRQMKRIKKSLRKKLALRPSKKVKEILREVSLQQQEFGAIFHDQIIPELAKNKIHLINDEDFTKQQQKEVDDFYHENIESFLQPQIVDFEKEKRIFIENNTIYYFVTFKGSEKVAFVNIPLNNHGRFYSFKATVDFYITFIDDIIRYKMPSVFSEEEITGIYEIKMSRDAELYIDDQYDGVLAEKIYDSLAQRTDGQPTRLLYDADMPKDFQKKLRKHLGLGKIDMMPGGRYHNFSDFFSFPNPSTNENLVHKALEPIPHRDLENSNNYFDSIREKDMLVHFPYMSFSYVENFIEKAANDADVTAIKISFYRVADESNLTTSLLKALEQGKEVTVFIEAKARFDEENNIIWGRKFEKKGAKVIYSYPKIKVHSKIFFVERIEKGEKLRYAYIGTGNFNSETSKIYCDHGLFTAKKKITKELERVFQVLEGDLIIPRAKNLLISPFNTRRDFTKLILQEIDYAKAGLEAKITAKMNSLEDPEIINLLYKASQSGVKVRLLIRGFTCLTAGIPKISENIYITSIIDRFLEHGRIYLFHNNGDEKMYFGSADWMTRNLDRRIEVLAPVMQEDIFNEFKDILHIQLSDNQKARIQDASEANAYVKPKAGEEKIKSQDKIYQYLKEKHTK